MSPKVAFFVWSLVNGRVLTVDKLISWGLVVINRCVPCKTAYEDVDHLLAGCAWVRRICCYFLSSYGFTSGWDCDILSKLNWSAPGHASNIGKLYWSLMFHAVVWSIWTERNKRTFEGKERTGQQLIGDIKTLIWNCSLSNREARR